MSLASSLQSMARNRPPMSVSERRGQANEPDSAVPSGIVLRAVEVSKSYGHVRANIGVTLDVRSGEIHAVLGENGAGKSTLMRILYGMEALDAGRIELVGHAK